MFVLAIGLAAVPLSGNASAHGGLPADGPVSRSATVTVAQRTVRPENRLARAQLLSFNDFHGAIDPPTGSAGLVNGVPAGGSEYLAGTVKKLTKQAGSTPTLTVGAGDMVGASPLVSAAFHDEPAVEALSTLGLQINAVGNHEFDEGVAELRRLQYGGCHPTDGCQDGDGFTGAKFQYLAANVVDKATRKPIFPAYTIRNLGGVKVGFIGMTLKGTPGIVNPAGVTSIDFLDEASTANKYASELTKRGVHALVLLFHQGGEQAGTAPDPSGCVGFDGNITPIVAKLDPAFGVVVSGHTHEYYSCALPNSSRTGRTVVTSAGVNGVLVTDIDVTLDKRTGTFAAVSARNVIAENGVKNPDGSWKTDASGAYVRDPAKADPAVKKVADKYRKAVAPIANKVIGAVTADLTRTANAAEETALGDVVADAQLAYTTSAGADLALMNPGGIRAALTFNASSGGEAPGQVTYGEAFAVQPFNNLVVTQTFTGQQIKDVLEQQFIGFGGQTTRRILQVSAGFTYSYDTTAAAGARVRDLMLNGAPLDLTAPYQVTTNDFLANGGDGFTNLTKGTGEVTAPAFDIDAFTAYLGTGTPVAPGPQNRITKLG